MNRDPSTMAPTDPRFVKAVIDMEAELGALRVLIDVAIASSIVTPQQLTAFENLVQQLSVLAEVDAEHEDAKDFRKRVGEALRTHLEQIRAMLPKP